MPLLHNMTARERLDLEVSAVLAGGGCVDIAVPWWIGFAAERKESMVAADPERCDLPPVAAAMWGDRLAAVVYAPRVDRDLGLTAVYRLRSGLDPDEIVVVFDGYVQKGSATPTPEEFERQQAGVDLQALHEHGFDCELAPISECLNVHLLHRDGARDFGRLPYVTKRGKRAVPFQWTHEDFSWTDVKGKPAEAGEPLRGTIPEAFNRIWEQPILMDHPALVQAAEVMGWGRERRRFHSARANLRLMKGDGFVVIDFVTETRPDWLEKDGRPIHDEP